MHETEISRTHPALILFVFDCSSSMFSPYGTLKISKGEFLTNLCNECIDQLILSCEKGDEIRSYFEIGIVGYGKGAEVLMPVRTVIDLAHHPLKMETEMIDSIPVERPIWFTDPTRDVFTDMFAGFKKAKRIVKRWVKRHMDSVPPVLLHVTDGEWTTRDPVATAIDIRERIRTHSGGCIVLNIHITSKRGNPVVFPSERPKSGGYEKALFDMSGELTGSFLKRAAEMYPHVSAGARGYMFNAQPNDLSKFFDIGTRLV